MTQRAETLKKSALVADTAENTRKLQKLDNMPDIDMTMPVNDESVGENLEVDDDDEDAGKPIILE